MMLMEQPRINAISFLIKDLDKCHEELSDRISKHIDIKTLGRREIKTNGRTDRQINMYIEVTLRLIT